MSETKKCRACGVVIRSNAPFGHCPKCLLELGFGAAPDDSTEPSDQSAIRNPQSPIETVRYFGDYELLEQIGRGGMGTVYRARQQSLNRLVALKMISGGEFASPSAVQRFQIEAEAAAKLDHPNIVPIYEIGMHRGQHYFSMGFIEGRNLAEEIRGGKFRSTGSPLHEPRSSRRKEAPSAFAETIRASSRRLLRFRGEGKAAKTSSKSAARQQQLAVARLMVTVARSVHYAHQRGVLHRDLKPSNILLDSDGQPHLTDCGLAKILEHEAGVTRTAEVMGTPSYMSPEQAAGRDLTTATDVYSLGAILYELLTGRPPFQGPSSAEILQQLATQEPPRPQSLNSFVDPDLATACLKCLEKDPLRNSKPISSTNPRSEPSCNPPSAFSTFTCAATPTPSR